MLNTMRHAHRFVWNRLGRYEPIAYLTVGLIAAGAFLALMLVSEINEGDTRAFDEAILLSLRQAGDLATPIGPAWLAHAFNDITALGGTTVLTLLTTFVVLYLLVIRQRPAALFVLLSILGGWGLSTFLKISVARARPDVVPHLVDVHDMSFPSGHAMVSAVTYLTLAALLSRSQESMKLRIFFMASATILTLLIGTSRVFLGVHFPTDVIGGWLLGTSWASFCWLLSRYLLPAVQKDGVSVTKAADGTG
ncbi:phosphatase PAP2 family protein [Rhizobium alvei]